MIFLQEKNSTALDNINLMFETIKPIKSGHRRGVISAVSPCVLSLVLMTMPPNVTQLRCLNYLRKTAAGSCVRFPMVPI